MTVFHNIKAIFRITLINTDCNLQMFPLSAVMQMNCNSRQIQQVRLDFSLLSRMTVLFFSLFVKLNKHLVSSLVQS